MSVGAAFRITGVVLVAAIVQVSILSSVEVLGGTPDVLLVTIVSVGLLRGAVVGAVAGFAAGLVVDTATLGTLGVTSLLLTIAGYWAGRYAETTGRDRVYAPALAISVLTLLVGLAGYALLFVLGEEVSARQALVSSLLPTVALNLIVGLPLYALCRRVVGRSEHRSLPSGQEAHAGV